MKFNLRLTIRVISAFVFAVALGVLLFLFLLDVAYQLLLKAYQSRIRRFLLPRA